MTTTTPVLTQRPLLRFRLLIGGHIQIDTKYSRMSTDELHKLALDHDLELDPTLKGAAMRSAIFRGLGLERVYDWQDPENNIVETDGDDLEIRFGRQKFARVNDDSTARVVERVVEKRVPVFLDGKNVEELRAYAAEEEIELPRDADSKAKIVGAIIAARS
jgi:hypothetical protein